MSAAALRDAIVRWGKSLFERGLTAGSSGNISARTRRRLHRHADQFLPRLSRCRAALQARRGRPACLRRRADQGTAAAFRLLRERGRAARAVVHLHSTYATALSCLSDVDPADAVPPITPYVVMRVGQVPVVPYTRPGSAEVAPLIDAVAPRPCRPCCCKIMDRSSPALRSRAPSSPSRSWRRPPSSPILTRGMKVRQLDAEQIADLDRHFKLK